MTYAAELPAWAAWLTAFFVLSGAALTLVGSVGLVTLQDFYQRVHAPTLGTSMGMAGILIGSIIFFSALEARPVLHELLIAIFVTITTPVTLMLLVRAARYRPPQNEPGGSATEDPVGRPALRDNRRWPP